MSRARLAITKTLGAAAVATNFRPPSEQDGLTVFLFHNVATEEHGFEALHRLCTSPTTFRSQVEWIVNRYTTIHPDVLYDLGPLPRRAALITFDDGFDGVFRLALPVLDSLGVPAVVFLNMGVVSGELNVAAEITYLDGLTPFPPLLTESAGAQAALRVTPAQLQKARELHTNDYDLHSASVSRFQGCYAGPDVIERWDGHELFRFGSHLWNHWPSACLTDAEFTDQFTRNANALGRLRSALPWLAATNGRISLDRVRLALELGAGRVFTGAGLPNRDPNVAVLHRIDLTGRSADPHVLSGLPIVGTAAALAARLRRNSSLRWTD